MNEVKEEVGELDSAYLEVDFLELEGMKGANALEELCRRAGIDKQGRVFVWASPPCETYSVANWSNLTRMFHYREKGEGHPPRKDGSKYGLKAAEHDRLAKIILGIMDEVKWGALENQQEGWRSNYTCYSGMPRDTR